MPDRWAVATGNWSNTATWNGGTLPGTGDDVFADGFTVTIDQNITVLSIRTTQRTGGTAGGQFSISGTRTVNANVTSGTTDCLVVTATSSNVTINGNVTGGTSANAEGFVVTQASCVFSVTGSVTGGSAASCNGIIVNASGITGTVTGTVSGGTNATARGISLTVGTLTINGNVTAGTANGILCSNTESLVTINGNPTNSNAVSVSNGRCVLVLTSDMTGTGTAGNVGVYGGSVLISGGNVIGGSSSGHNAIVQTAGFCRIFGNVTASASSLSIDSLGGDLYVVGNVLASGTQNSIRSANVSMVVIGNVSGGSTGDGINSEASGIIVVHGTVTGGSSAGGHGIWHSGRADIRIFGSEVAGAGGAAAVSNTGTGTKTTTAIGGGGSSLPLIGPGGLVY